MTVTEQQQQLLVNPMMPSFLQAITTSKDNDNNMSAAECGVLQAAVWGSAAAAAVAEPRSDAASVITGIVEESPMESNKENALARSIQLAHLTAAVELARRQATKTKQFKETPETEWAMTVSRDLPMETIRKLKGLYRDRKKEMKKSRGLKLTDISSQIIFQDRSKHDHSNFAKWINDKQGRRGRGGINLVILLVWVRLCYGADQSETLLRKTD